MGILHVADRMKGWLKLLAEVPADPEPAERGSHHAERIRPVNDAAAEPSQCWPWW